MTTPVLKTARLTLRPLRIGDADDVCSNIANANVIDRLDDLPWPYEKHHAESFIEQTSNRLSDGTALVLGIEHEDAIIGVAGIEPRYGGPFLGYWLGESYWGKGYMTEALQALIAHYFATTGNQSLTSGMYADNTASRRVQEKLGFIELDERWEHCKRGESLFGLATRLDRSRFEARQA